MPVDRGNHEEVLHGLWIKGQQPCLGERSSELLNSTVAAALLVTYTYIPPRSPRKVVLLAVGLGTCLVSTWPTLGDIPKAMGQKNINCPRSCNLHSCQTFGPQASSAVRWLQKHRCECLAADGHHQLNLPQDNTVQRGLSSCEKGFGGPYRVTLISDQPNTQRDNPETPLSSKCYTADQEPCPGQTSCPKSRVL